MPGISIVFATGHEYLINRETLPDISRTLIRRWPDNTDPLADLKTLLLLLGHQRAIATVEPFTARPPIIAEQDTLVGIQCSAIAS